MSVNAMPQKSAIFSCLGGKTSANRVNGLAFVGKTVFAPTRLTTNTTEEGNGQ